MPASSNSALISPRRTFDGLSLAWAVAVQLARSVQAFTLFATHYFELTSLPGQCPNMANVHLDATEHQDHVVFLHHIQEGPASRSFGLQVAKLAGTNCGNSRRRGAPGRMRLLPRLTCSAPRHRTRWWKSWRRWMWTGSPRARRWRSSTSCSGGCREGALYGASLHRAALQIDSPCR